MKKITAALCALTVTATAFCSCGKEASPNSSVGGSESTAEVATSSDAKAEIYLAEDGTPYYYDADGNKMIVYAYADEEYSEEEEEYDPTEYYIYDYYDMNGLSFDIPEGWVADSSMAIPMVYQEADSLDSIDYNESIVILPADDVFGTETPGVNEDSITEYFDDCVEQGYYSEYTLTDSGEATFGGDAAYYDLTLIPAADEDYGDVSELRVRYVAMAGEGGYCAVITAYNNDESFDKTVEAFAAIAESFAVSEDAGDTEDTEETEETEDTEETETEE